MNITVNRRLSRAAVETMSIIAYHQPITRAEVEEIRGVALSRGTLDTLLEAGWVQPRGRRKVPGRPLQWGTTDAFLDHFGLDSLAALPGIDDLKAAGLLDRRQGLTSIAMPELEEEDDGYDGRIGGQENLFPLDSERADPDVYYASDTGSSTTDDLP
jgi:segregation and condensation protein B